eukprot:CAMPEP_0172705540 /NCGR_PEP_ID=MMETSP1074-20121228/43926_1 /TAXON_ID=2916 /ORGANISM="Ceratium fusus, Strain PA161109" /LENGTH=75 /DNA_ID=CAMNT_0013527929 /DNA_START=136 /DNA_END=364 /DNA_ORIENTATION=-
MTWSHTSKLLALPGFAVNVSWVNAINAIGLAPRVAAVLSEAGVAVILATSRVQQLADALEQFLWTHAAGFGSQPL